MRWSTSKAVVGSLEGDVVRVLVGDEQREFTIHRALLSDSCAFFRGHLESIPIRSTTAPRGNDPDDDDDDSVLWLPNEGPDMFEIFVLWLYQRRRFPAFLTHALPSHIPSPTTASTTSTSTPSPTNPQIEQFRTLRTNLVRLHLFAAIIDLPAAQDAAMDALQDLYLRFDWSMSPRFLAFLYGDCEAQHAAVRLRKWAVAMLAWTLHGAAAGSLPSPTTPASAPLPSTTSTSTTSPTKPPPPTSLPTPPGGPVLGPGPDVERLFTQYPLLRADYRLHLQKMAQSRADVAVKNPQLRLPANGLRSGERLFGFRQCTFHSHRAAVGEGPCPHAVGYGFVNPPGSTGSGGVGGAGGFGFGSGGVGVPGVDVPPVPALPALSGGMAGTVRSASLGRRKGGWKMGTGKRVGTGSGTTGEGRRDKEEVESDRDEELITPVGEWGGSVLDL
ncbi:hypothetical protein B0J18DRAFT_248621 [Chaetomium sp. MPI-SDFR-AT-0129]|nr:hypothetical protein B0J18DRAFT_248621 [Chaetomium sp. MPI-SDFR-AT-0129]